MARSTLGLMVASFEASQSELVVLSPNGAILAVNDAWRRFGWENGAGSLCGVGANYMQVTERAADGGDEVAVTAIAALAAVCDGHADRAAMDYACHAPRGQHWFRLRAERLPGRHEVLVTHDEITDHVQEGVRLLNQHPPSPDEIAWRSSLRRVLGGTETELTATSLDVEPA
jgi:hypothetical protein